MESSFADSLLRSARYGDEAVVFEIFSHQDNHTLINYQGANQKTALMEAANYGQLKIVEALLKFNPNLEVLDKNGNNALMCALKADILHQHTKRIVEVMLSAGINPNQRDSAGHNAIGLLLNLYERSKNSEHAVYIKEFLESDFLSMLDNLLAHNTQMTLPSNYGDGYALLWAVEKEETRALIIFLKRGASTHFRGGDNKTALMLAAERNTPLIFDVILSSCKSADEFDAFWEEIKDVFLEERLARIAGKYQNKFRRAINHRII